MTEIPESVMEEARECCPVCGEDFAAADVCAADIELGTCHAECLEGCPVVDLETGDPTFGSISTFVYDEKGALEDRVARAILAAEKRGEERERERLANMLDPEVGLPSDRLLRVIHADVETRGRKNNKFAVTVHHRNIVLSAVAAAIRKGSD